MATLARVSVLIVDDSRADAKLTELWLRKADFVGDVKVARSGREGLDILQHSEKSGQPAVRWLVLLDIQLPDMLGWDVLEELHRHAPQAQVQVMVLTGTIRVEDAHRARQYGAARYLEKPFDGDEFAALIAEIETVLHEGDQRV